jgi:hypothetical protein
MLGVAGDTLTVLTVCVGELTVTDAVALLPPIVTVMVAVPAATPVTTPEVDTVAALVFELVHVAG